MQTIEFETQLAKNLAQDLDTVQSQALLDIIESINDKYNALLEKLEKDGTVLDK